MKPLQILNHALLQVAGNARQVLRIVALPLALGAVLLVLTMPLIRSVAAWGPGWLRIAILLLILVMLLLTVWVAVNFHRMVLLGETFGWRPPVHRRETLAYILQSLPLLVLLVLLGLILGFLGMALLRALAAEGAPPRGLVMLVQLVSGLITAAVTLRLMAMLPAVAIGETISGAFAAMRGSWPTLFGLAAITLFLQLVAEALVRLVAGAMVGEGGQLAAGARLVVLLVQLLLQGGLGVLGISILTTLYGHYIQGRPLR